MFRRLLPLAALVITLSVLAQDNKKDDLGDLIDDAGKGTKFRLVALGKEDEKLDSLLFWRTHFGAVAARTTPVRFRLDDTDVIVPVLNPKSEASGREAYSYPTEGRVKLTLGRRVLRPGNIPIDVKGGEPNSEHPAIKISKGEVLVHCAPIRFEVVDERGAPVPTSLKLGDDRGSYLREEARFSVLIAYLPVGGEYQSSLGTFGVTADGKVKGVRLAQGVSVTAEGLRRTVPAEPVSVLSAAPEVVRLVGPAKEKQAGASVSLFVPTVSAPGEPVWLAVSRKEYRQETGQTFGADHFSIRIEDEKLLAVGKGEPSPALVARAARALNTTADDLAWVAPRLPSSVLGPTPLNVTTRSLGNHQVHLVALSDGKLNIVPHRWRTVFERRETATYTVLLPRGSKAGEAKVMLQAEGRKEPLQLGKVGLPAVEDRAFDSRLFTVNITDLPPGLHQLWLESDAGKSGKVPVRVVSLEPRSPFFTHSMSGCTACWPTSDEGLKVLEDSGIEMVAATGANSNLTTQLPRLDANLAGRLRTLGLPADLAVEPTANDRLLERLLRHRLKFIDLTVVRAPGFYMEGLSYHHSYQPSVERMIRRMQLFAQQTADYPSLWGVNYSWFPQLYGYAEGGVPTDAHVGERNKVLIENAKAAGFKPLSPQEQEWVQKNRTSTDPKTRERVLALMKQAVDWRNATQELGWGKHNELYNKAVREVKPDLACTLFENAGHDEPKRLRSMFRDMSAQCYESYTDFGDWPMSAGFVTDWSHGQSPGQPVWLTTCWGTSEEGKMKSLFHAFARGLEGGGVPMQGNFPLSTLERRGKGLRFVSQYGAIAKHAKPDARVAILARDAHAVFGRLLWDCHAVYYHLTRLGYPPAILHGDTAAKGIPEETKVLVLVKEEMPLEPELRKIIDGFIKRGGSVLTIGPCTDTIEGAIAVKELPKHLWELKGFHPESHEAMWKDFEQLREPLGEAMKKTGVSPLATVDAALGYAPSMDAGPIRYVAVIADGKGMHSNVFEPISDMPVSLEGTGWKVRDLVKQKDLKTEEKDGRTLVKVDLLTEPTTLLAIYRKAPSRLSAWVTEALTAGSHLKAVVATTDAQGGSLGQVPMRLVLKAPDGAVQEEVFMAADDQVRFELPALSRAGVWKLTIQELLTGLTATVDVKLADRKDHSTAIAVRPVHVPDGRHLTAFTQRKGEKLVIVEPEQTHLLSVARQLVDSLKKAGVEARLWQVRPEEYDTHPVRWYPPSADRERLKEIDAGRLIGVRESLRPYIDTVKRVHVPERGGYSDMDPPYMVGRDCIVFSGGRLAESLRAVTPWMETAHGPGKGQGRIIVCFSPFLPDRQAVAVIAQDVQGIEVAAKVLADEFAKQPPAPRKGTTNVSRLEEYEVLQSERTPVPTPYAGYSPIQRVERLLAGPDGRVTLFLKGKKDNVAFVDPDVRVTATFHVDPLLAGYARLDSNGNLQMPLRKVTATHPGWGFPTELELALHTIAPDGKLKQELQAFRGAPGVPDFEGGIRWSADGGSTILGRPGGFFWRTKDDKAWRRYDDTPHAPVRFSVLYPRQPTGVTFSPEGRYVLFTMDSRPPFGGLNSVYPHPWSVETVLFDLHEGKRVWALKAPEGNSTYAVHSRFASVSRNANLTVFVDYDGTIHMVEKNGKVYLSEKIVESPHDSGGRAGPHEGIGCRINPAATMALAAFRSMLVTIYNGKVHRIPLPGTSSACMSNGHVVAACEDGKIHCFDMIGKPLWTVDTKSAAPLVAAGKEDTLFVALGDGHLLVLDGKGKELRRTNVVAAADRERHELKPADDIVKVAAPVEYVEPDTLAIAKERLSAKEIAQWKPSTGSKAQFGRFFRCVEEKAELSAGPDAGEFFAHLVYRRPAGNKSLKLMTAGRDGPETFLLDLPTPEYRVIDIPLRGPKAKVTLVPDGEVEIAEFSLWSFKWPGSNLAYVRPAGVEEKPMPKGGDDILDDLEGKKGPAGKLKECRVWWPNTDFDSVRGPWLPAPLDPLAVVDGKRFGGGKLAPWANVYLNFPPSRGGFFTVDLTEELTPSLLATYDRSVKQSEVCAQIVAIRFEAKEALTGGNLLGGAVGNDQFWRILPLTRNKLRVLGVHVIKDEKTGPGLSEIELYR